jgi:hypothetical protein
MNRSGCEKQAQVLAGILCGHLVPEIEAHAQSCPVCSEVRLVAELLQEARLADYELNALPDPGLIWQAARARARERALAKATLPIRIMRTCAAALAIFAAPWIVVEFLHPGAWTVTLGFGRSPSIDGNWLSALTSTTLLGITATLACIAVGSWYMLREK